MLTIDDILANVADQNRGAWFDVADPVTGEPTGIRFKVAGPDSETQHRARLTLSDELAEMADDEGKVTAEQREKARIASLARCCLDWEITEDGKPVPFNHKACVRVLTAAAWLQAQVDAFASDRKAHRGDA